MQSLQVQVLFHSDNTSGQKLKIVPWFHVANIIGIYNKKHLFSIEIYWKGKIHKKRTVCLKESILKRKIVILMFRKAGNSEG